MKWSPTCYHQYLSSLKSFQVWDESKRSLSKIPRLRFFILWNFDIYLEERLFGDVLKNDRYLQLHSIQTVITIVFRHIVLSWFWISSSCFLPWENQCNSGVSSDQQKLCFGHDGVPNRVLGWDLFLPRDEGTMGNKQHGSCIGGGGWNYMKVGYNTYWQVLHSCNKEISRGRTCIGDSWSV